MRDSTKLLHALSPATCNIRQSSGSPRDNPVVQQASYQPSVVNGVRQVLHESTNKLKGDLTERYSVFP